MVVTATLAGAGRGTKVGVTQDLQLAGAAAQYGRGMISDVTAVLMRDFSANMAARIDAAERGETPAQASTASPAPSRVTTLPRRKTSQSRCPSSALRVASSDPARPAATSLGSSS